MEDHIKNLILKYLSYQDANVSDEQKAKMREYGMSNESNHRYGISLSQFFVKYGEEKVHELAKILHNDFKWRMKFFIDISAYGSSMSWTYWDMAKQYYFFINPKEQKLILYRVANPMDDKTLQTEIVCRQMGWELYHSEMRESILAKLSGHSSAIEYLIKTPKETGELRSWDYSNLGFSVLNIELHKKINEPVQTFTLSKLTPYNEVKRDENL